MKTRKLLSLILSFSMIMSLAIGVSNVSASESTNEYTLVASGSGFSGTNDGNLTRMIAGAGVQWAGLSGLNNTLTKAAKDNGQIIEIEFTVYRPDYTDYALISLNQTNGWGPTLEISPYGIRLVNGSIYAKSSYNSNAYCYAGGATQNKIIWKFDLESMKQRIDVEDCFDNAGHRTSATTDWVDIGTGSYGWLNDSWSGLASPDGSGNSIQITNPKWKITTDLVVEDGYVVRNLGGSGFSGGTAASANNFTIGANVQYTGLSGLTGEITKAAKDNGQIVEIEFTVYRPDYTDYAYISLNQNNGWGPTLEISPYGIRLMNGSVYAKSSYNSNAYCYAGGATKNKIIWKFDLGSMKQRIDVEDCFDNAGHRTSATTDWVDIGTGSYGWIKDSWTGIASPAGSGSSIVVQNPKWRILDFSEFKCELKGIDTVTSFSDLAAKATQTVKIKADYVNTTGEEKQVYLIVAYYSDANQLVYTDWIVIDSKNAAGYDYLVPAVNGATNAKVFAWDGFDTLTPLSDCLNFE